MLGKLVDIVCVILTSVSVHQQRTGHCRKLHKRIYHRQGLFLLVETCKKLSLGLVIGRYQGLIIAPEYDQTNISAPSGFAQISLLPTRDVAWSSRKHTPKKMKRPGPVTQDELEERSDLSEPEDDQEAKTKEETVNC